MSKLRSEAGCQNRRLFELWRITSVALESVSSLRGEGLAEQTATRFMKCAHCKAEVLPRWKVCPECGTATGNPGGAKSAAPGTELRREPSRLTSASSLSDLAEAASARVEDRMRTIQESVEARLSRVSAFDRSVRAGKGALSKAAMSSYAPVPGLDGLLRPQPDELAQANRSVLASSFVERNPAYKRKAEAIGFHFVGNDSMVNAFATDGPMKISDGITLKPPAVVFLGGLANAMCLVSVTMATYLKNRLDSTLRFAFQDLGRAIVANQGRFSTEEAARIFDRDLGFKTQELLRSDPESTFAVARGVRLSMYLHTISHEVGHIALSHTLGRIPNLDVSRNQEREADSFAWSVVSSCPDREFHFLGGVLTEALFVWIDRAAGSPEVSTHPHSRERFNNAFVSNSEAARETQQAFGLDQRRFTELLPL